MAPNLRAAPPETTPGGTIDISRRRLSATVAFEWAARVIGVALGIAVMAILTRYLGPGRFGDLSLALALTGVATAATDVGFKQTAIREAAIDPASRDVLAGTYVVIRGSVAALLFAIVVVIGALLADSAEVAITVAIIAGVLLLSFVGSAGFLLHVRLRNELFAASILVQSVLWLAVAVWGAAQGWSLVGIALGYLAAGAAQALFTFWMARRLVPFRISLDRTRARVLLRSALPLSAGGLFIALTLRLDGILVYEINGAADAGLYTSAYRVVEQLSIVPVALVGLLGPLLASWRMKDPARFRRAITRFCRYLTLVSVPVTFAIFVLASPIVTLLFGSEFKEAGDYLALLAFAYLGTAVSSLFFSALVAAGRMRAIAITQGALLAAVAAADLALLPSFGPIAAAAVTVAAEIGLAIAFYLQLYALRLAQPPSRGALRLLVPVALMLLAGWAVASVGALAVAVLGSFAFCVGAFLSRLISVAELRSLVSRDVVASV